MKIIQTVKSWFGAGAEGSFRGPAIGFSEFDNGFEIPFGNGFERGLDVQGKGARNVPAVHRCVMATAEAVSQCRPRHYREKDGKVEEVKNSAAFRVMRKPNLFQTWPQFITAAIISMKYEGECVAIVKRNKRYEVESLFLVPKGGYTPHILEHSGELFYAIGEDPFMFSGIDYLVPNRDVLHLRQHSSRHPLKGESDLAAAALAIGTNVALSASQATFFSRMNRPSGILSTDAILSKDQTLQLRAAFDAQSKTWETGGLPILSAGLHFEQMGINSVDAQLIEAQKMSISDIAMAFGVPLPVIGDLSNATMSNSEATINMWLSISLGALLENIERSLDVLFDLPANEHIDLDVTGLLRTDLEGRVSAYTKGIQGGLYTPNEMRRKEGLSDLEGGDEIFLQRQMTSVSLLKELEEAEIAAKLEDPSEPKPIVDQVVEEVVPTKSVEEESFILKQYMKQSIIK